MDCLPANALECPDCGHEKLLAFTCKGRHFCPSCHQRRVRSTSDWIATAVCHPVPHRQSVLTIPKVLLGLPDGKLGAIAADGLFAPVRAGALACP